MYIKSPFISTRAVGRALSGCCAVRRKGQVHRQSATYKSIYNLRHGLGANRREKMHVELNGGVYW